MNRIFTLITEYWRARNSWHLSRKQIDAIWQKAKSKLDFSKIEIQNIEQYRHDFAKQNVLNINYEDAIKIKKDDIKRGYSIGFSTGTSGGNRGIFITNNFERTTYLGQILGKAFSPIELLKIRKIALCLRSDNELYDCPRNIDLRFFPLSVNSNNIAREIINFAPDVLIAPTQILIKIAEQSEGWENLRRIFWGAEGMNLYERTFVHKRLKIAPQTIYQATEGFLGISCINGKLHLNEDLMIFEQKKMPKQRFIPIVTDLKRVSQNVIRLELDDILLPCECRCGSQMMAVSKISRRGDFWHLGSGFYADEIEDLIAPFVEPSHDWVVIGGKEFIEVACEFDNDFDIIKVKLSHFAINVVKIPFSKDMNFPKRRHIRWRE